MKKLKVQIIKGLKDNLKVIVLSKNYSVMMIVTENLKMRRV